MGIPPDHSDHLDRLVGRCAFGVDADGYHLKRSGYSGELFEQLAKSVSPQPRILEIGSGTGLGTEGLLRLSPSFLTLLEPDPRLCEVLEQRFSAPSIEVICGTFPETVLSHNYDLIACAAAFHWLEPVSALGAVRSLLAPGGTWAMWWNCYFGHGQSDPFSEGVAEILKQNDVALPPSYKGQMHYAVDVDYHFAMLSESGFQNIESIILQNFRELDAKDARALYQTFSFISLLPPGKKERVLDQIGDLVNSDFNGLARSLVVTPLYFCSSS
jgi:SAM-dependent methyltransferase